MRRLGVFVFYDPQGVVDDYVLFLLRAMRNVCTEIVTICNGKLTDDGRRRLSEWSEIIFCRENSGMDAGALKDYFTNLGRREDWSSFDELVWFNDTCYGPLVSMKQVFEEMEQRDPCDFWGITVHAKSNAKWPGSRQPGIAEHLQSYFITVKQPLLGDERFYRFWKEMNVSDNFNATVANYELSLTKTFASWGYTYTAFCDTRKRDANPDGVCNPATDAMYLLVSQYDCPFVKRKNFIRSNAEATVSTNGEQVGRTVKYISSHTEYEMRLIYQNLERLYDQDLWRGNLCLDFTLSSEYSLNASVQPALILAELDHEDAVHELLDSLCALPENCDLTVVTRSAELVPVIEKLLPPCRVMVFPNRAHGLASLFAVLKQMEINCYHYFCILQEEWGEPANGLHISESSMRFSLYGNLVEGPHFIRNVLSTFEKNPQIGILNPPIFPQSRKDGNIRFDLKKSAEKYGVTLPCHMGDGNSFCQPSLWCRREVVLAVLEKLDGQMQQAGPGVLEHLLTYIALNNGYGCGIVKESRQAACQQESQRWLIEGLYSGTLDLRLFRIRRQFQVVAAIRSGKCSPENADITLMDLRKLIFETVLYCVEKKFNPCISQLKKDIFFLGARDVYNVYRQVKNAKRRFS